MPRQESMEQSLYAAIHVTFVNPIHHSAPKCTHELCSQITMAGTHTREPTPEGVNRGKRHSRASYRLQITMAGTRTKEPAPGGVNRGKRYSRASYRLQITMAGTHTREPAPQGVHRGKRNSRASYRLQTTIPRRPSWQALQQSLL